MQIELLIENAQRSINQTQLYLNELKAIMANNEKKDNFKKEVLSKRKIRK